MLTYRDPVHVDRTALPALGLPRQAEIRSGDRRHCHCHRRHEPLERKPIDRVRARLEALLKANAAPRCGARSKRTGKPCRGAAMPNGRCKFHGGKSTGPRTPEGLARSRRANWKHGHFSREAKAERSRVRAAILALRDLCELDLRSCSPLCPHQSNSGSRWLDLNFGVAGFG